MAETTEQPPIETPTPTTSSTTSVEPSNTTAGLSENQPSSDDIDTNWDECIDSFYGMNLREDLLRGIFAYGFEKPSAIQQRAIKPVILGKDVIAQAQSGMCFYFFTFFSFVVEDMPSLIHVLSSI